MLYCIQRWLGLVLDLIVAALAVLLMATQVPGISSGPALGVAMVSVLGFGQSSSQVIVFYTELETSLGAIARIREYTTGIVPEDGPGEDGREVVPAGWPEKGEVRFEKVCAAYGPEDELVLKDIPLEVLPGQVVGICGRTGR
jgi:ABC-type multidrug transport system fused ATPase/permease subunit